MYGPEEQQAALSVPERLKTARMAGHLVAPEDFAGLRLLHRDPTVMRTLSATGEPLPEEETKSFIRRAMQWQAAGLGLWVFELDYTNTFIGYCGLKPVTIEGEPCVELLYAVRAAQWGQGYGSEMARVVLNAGFHTLGLREIVCFTLPENTASRRVMEKQSFVYEKDIEHAGLRHVFYRLKRP